MADDEKRTAGKTGPARITLGRTGLDVCRLGFGGIPIMRISLDEAAEVVRYVLELGADFVDSARVYGHSEEAIGKALAGWRGRIVVSTKSTNRSADGILGDVETSLKKLGRDVIDIYNLHNVSSEEIYNKVMGPGGALSGLKKARKRGMIRFIGITSHKREILEKAIESGEFDTIMACYSLLEPETGDAVFPMARKAGLGIIAMKSLSGGVIEDAALALKFCLAQPDVALIPGVESKEKAKANWDIFLGDWSLSDADRRKIEELRQEHKGSFCHRCDYCQPCPQEVPIQAILGLPSILKRMGGSPRGKRWISQLIEKGENCVNCGECLSRCPYELPIPDLIEKNIAMAKQAIREV